MASWSISAETSDRLYPLQLALQDWSTGHNHSPPLGTDAIKQKSWDKPTVDSCKELLLDSVQDSQNRTHLLASFCKESGYWLEAPPISSLGLHLDDNIIIMRIAVALRLGAPLCCPHSCEQCGTTVDEPATHYTVKNPGSTFMPFGCE